MKILLPTTRSAPQTLFMFLSLLLGITLFSSDTWSKSESASSSESISDEKVEQLITTLESETARKEFIENLKTLINTDEKTNDNQFSISQSLPINSTGSELVQQYLDALTSIGISENLVGQIILISLSFLLLVTLALLNKYLANNLNRKLKPIRRKLHLSPERFEIIFKTQSFIGYVIAICLAVYTVINVLSLWPENFISVASYKSLVGTCLTLIVIAALAGLAWELCNAFLEYGTRHARNVTEARLNTVIPVVRNVLFLTIGTLFLLVALSEIGVNIMPLLAGAGVAGIALGFGAQAVIKDFITGFIVVIEDIFQVGDVICISDCSGLVERITLRKVQLRSLDGTVHTVPFSEVTVINNYTKEYSYYLLDIGVAYRESVDEVIECLNDIDQELRDDKHFGSLILEPLEVLGVDKFADSAVVVRARTKTVAIEKWNVGREFNRRIKMLFDERGIEIPFPHQTIYFGQDKEGSAPSAQVALTDGKANNDEASTDEPHHSEDKE